MYDGSHSVIFSTKNTWTDWFLIPDSRPVFAPPSPKTDFLDIPGLDGSLDISELLTGYPVYNDREGSMKFIVDNGHREWQELYSEIMDFLHGKRMKAVLTDDPGYYYEGRFAVNEWESQKSNSVITIEYKTGPYKWETSETVLLNLTATTSGVTRTISAGTYGAAPILPQFIVTEAPPTGLAVQFVNPTLNINKTISMTTGTHQPAEFVLYGGNVTMTFTGVGKVSVRIRKGRL